MFKTESPLPFILVVVGATLILINGLWIGLNNYPIILASAPASSLSQVYNTTKLNMTSVNSSALAPTGFWNRINLGIPDYSENAWLVVWLIFAALSLMCGLSLTIDPRPHGNLSPIIVLCSFASLAIGGGFIIGFVLSLVGGLAGIEWPKPLHNTSIGRFLRALRLDSSLYRTVREETHHLSQALWVLVFLNIISGVSYGIYNLTYLKGNSSVGELSRILFLGRITTDFSIFAYPLMYIGLAVAKWIILSLLIYVVATKLMDGKCEFAGLAANVAFVYAPIALQALIPMMYSNQPQQLALYIYAATNIWMILGLVIAVTRTLEVTMAKALGVVAFCGGAYWIINYLVIVPTLEVPGIWYTLKPPSMVLLLFSISTIVALMLGVFSKRKRI